MCLPVPIYERVAQQSQSLKVIVYESWIDVGFFWCCRPDSPLNPPSWLRLKMHFKMEKLSKLLDLLYHFNPSWFVTRPSFSHFLFSGILRGTHKLQRMCVYPCVLYKHVSMHVKRDKKCFAKTVKVVQIYNQRLKINLKCLRCLLSSLCAESRTNIQIFKWQRWCDTEPF